ncbi:type II toxin-antitoxin system RelE/ParE family toxin [Halochromatium glycolicum]|uniref:Plasmid stabilization protein n=1 Tax=Halochromatium glycolicum TaxID=85075 RepID=A0AAJ0U4E5_9GAMM|nr:type II toxin-antitoxin system RelE/ParE family toxin [Halochromatium glycolicum]MBK1705098.1 plasmid stabilization protein [Halochromatium glycolicum]
MARVYQRATARRDLIQHVVHLAETAGDETADRFLTNARSTFADLAEQPQIGAYLNLSNPALKHMRKWRVRGFEKYLVFYLPRPDGMSVIRVLHASRDWWGLFGIETD